MPANFSNTTTILQISFLNPCNSLKSSNFFETSAFHFVSVCCFIFLAWDLRTASALVCVKRLTDSLSLGTESTGLHMTIKLSEGTKFKWKTYSKFWEIQSIPKSTHHLHGFPPLTADTPISFANSSYRWHASRVSWGKYRIHCLLVRDRSSIKFMSLSEGGLEGKNILD